MTSSRSFRPALLAGLLLAPLVALAQPAQTPAAVRQYQAMQTLKAMAASTKKPAVSEIASQVRSANNPDVLVGMDAMTPTQALRICGFAEHAVLVSSDMIGESANRTLLQQMAPAWNDAKVFALQCNARHVSLRGTTMARQPDAKRTDDYLLPLRMHAELLVGYYARVSVTVASPDTPLLQRQAILREALPAADMAVRSLSLHSRAQHQQKVQQQVNQVANADKSLVAPLLAVFNTTECNDACKLLNTQPATL